ncbi:hypothetical protein [Thalassovita mediterranea]|jgi:hypothetical protein|uniref:Uncharacterized protein n=1 Tax=Thalassovita mediterranea TaxID=340021 RepID=A0A0P1GR05_9RHOB|nr:hypothetical protein [Thalassovita mediterranea]CUH84935.1 hypothetical protein TM5383_02156 [Thalassovita mediterranea]SIS28993.1 hypothetical protein SAMN05421685_101764 [Thalassovita mediterranea]
MSQDAQKPQKSPHQRAVATPQEPKQGKRGAPQPFVFTDFAMI